jgi:hypothetical protein
MTVSGSTDGLDLGLDRGQLFRRHPDRGRRRSDGLTVVHRHHLRGFGCREKKKAPSSRRLARVPLISSS